MLFQNCCMTEFNIYQQVCSGCSVQGYNNLYSFRRLTIFRRNMLHLLLGFRDWLLNSCWSSPAQWFLVPSPMGLTTIFYTLTALGAFRLSPLNVWIVKCLLKCWMWMQHASPEHHYHSTGLYGVTTQNNQLLQSRTTYLHFRYAHSLQSY
jgi:hypothetical protein